MYYVLDFRDHTFVTCDDTFEVLGVIEGQPEDAFEIIDGSQEYVRFSVKEFLKEVDVRW